MASTSDMPDKALVTGGSGYFGSLLVAELRAPQLFENLHCPNDALLVRALRVVLPHHVLLASR